MMTMSIKNRSKNYITVYTNMYLMITYGAVRFLASFHLFLVTEGEFTNLNLIAKKMSFGVL